MKRNSEMIVAKVQSAGFARKAKYVKIFRNSHACA